MNNKAILIEEALSLCHEILSVIPPDDRCIFVNMARINESELEGLIKEYTQISPIYAYKCQTLLKFLEHEKVILYFKEGSWYTRIRKVEDVRTERRKYPTIYSRMEEVLGEELSLSLIAGDLTRIALKAKLIDESEEIGIYIKYEPDAATSAGLFLESYGPAPVEYGIAFISKKFLITFINKYEHLAPTYDDITHEINFRGKTHILKGEKQPGILCILVNNINSLVSKSALLNVAAERPPNKTASKQLKSNINHLKTQLKAWYGNSLIITEHGGEYGLFVNQK